MNSNAGNQLLKNLQQILELGSMAKRRSINVWIAKKQTGTMLVSTLLRLRHCHELSIIHNTVIFNNFRTIISPLLLSTIDLLGIFEAQPSTRSLVEQAHQMSLCVCLVSGAPQDRSQLAW